MIERQAYPLAINTYVSRSREAKEELTSNENALQDMQQITSLLNFSQMLCERGIDGVLQLCKEVTAITQGRAHLCLGMHLKRDQLSSTARLTFPVQFGQSVYGTLMISADVSNADTSAMSLASAHLLTQMCSWLLHTFEQSAFIQYQRKNLDYFINGPLTRREQEVLSLICCGHNRDQIAEILCITPATVGKHFQHIYDHLGVHCEHDVLLVAYMVGLFSPFKNFAEREIF
jgi:ATP/maltotriose-dependent transcriptional regulator MalT